jgi:hypothetical protein
MTFAASGDVGYDYLTPLWPAAAPNVVSVGGTTLHYAANSRGFTETAWSAGGTKPTPEALAPGAGGGGCAVEEPKPSWETDTGCNGRTENDISAVADWDLSPVAIYTTFERPGWEVWGGTSAATPLVAGAYALSNRYTRSLGARGIWKYAAERRPINDVVSGTTAGKTGCEPSYMCTAGPGYDGPTGWGTPWGAPTLPMVTNELANASFALTTSKECGEAPQGWTMRPNGGTTSECRYVNAERAQQGNVFEEWNASANAASISQDVLEAPLVGQNYTFSIWVRAPYGAAKGVIQILGLKAGEVIGDAQQTKFSFKAGETEWRQVSVPLTVTGDGEERIRVQVYEETPGANIDLDGAQLTQNFLGDASFALTASRACGEAPPGWTMRPNGGTTSECRYVDEERAQQGGVFEEWQGSVSGASISQDVLEEPQVGQNYTFSVWVRAPQEPVSGVIAVYGLKPSEVIGDRQETHFTTAGKGWQRIAVPLTVTASGEERIRVQLYEQSPGRNLDLDGAALR